MAEPEIIQPPRGTTHACPVDGSGVTPCCGYSPFELPRGDMMTTDGDRVTCGREQRCAREGCSLAPHQKGTTHIAIAPSGRAQPFW